MNHNNHVDFELLFKDECYAIQGAIFTVYREMGNGFLEAVYQECLEREFSRCGIPFVAHPELHLRYHGELLRQSYIPDFVCYDMIIIELKAVKTLTTEHDAQLLNYLKATGKRLGLLVNFGEYPKAMVRRLVL